MDTARLHAQERGLEEGLRGTEPLIANGDDLAVGKFIGLLEGGGGSSSGHLLLKVKGDIAELLLDVTDNLTLPMYPGIADRMQKEITALAPSTIKIKIIAPP